ncbi:MAG: response regulator [Cyanobacteria bacterium SZAS LIN-3]|nr:response regulator [Cyanobacteria bacterium SZAS LIN-3]
METPKILVAGSSQKSVALTRAAIEPLDYQMVTAQPMSVALFLAQKNLPEVIVSDLKMLDGDGISFLNEIKVDPELAKIPFIFLVDEPTDEATEISAITRGARLICLNSMAAADFRQVLEPLINERLSQKVKRPEETPE